MLEGILPNFCTHCIRIPLRSSSVDVGNGRDWHILPVLPFANHFYAQPDSAVPGYNQMLPNVLPNGQSAFPVFALNVLSVALHWDSASNASPVRNTLDVSSIAIAVFTYKYILAYLQL